MAACTPQAPPVDDLTVWQPRGKWAGRAGQQSDPFISTTGLLRITWEARRVPGKTEGTRQEAEDRTHPRSDVGETFRIILHSDVSGRPLLVAVDRHGPGKDITYVTEDPRAFFFVIDSDGFEWSVEVAEGIPARRKEPSRN